MQQDHLQEHEVPKMAEAAATLASLAQVQEQKLVDKRGHANKPRIKIISQEIQSGKRLPPSA